MRIRVSGKDLAQLKADVGVCFAYEGDSAPRIGKGQSEKRAVAAQGPAEAMVALRKMRDYVEKNFDNVGEQFPEEARRIHYGETEAHDIYGQASDEEAEALREEGVAFQKLPFPLQKEN